MMNGEIGCGRSDRPLSVVIAPDSFKESLSSEGVCQAVEEGLRCRFDELGVSACIQKVAMSDGGEGFMDVVARNKDVIIYSREVPGPLEGQVVISRYGYEAATRTCYMAVSESAGLEQVPVQLRSPLRTSTYGIGVLMKYIIEAHDPVQIVIGAGGSATHDCGMGCIAALNEMKRVCGDDFDGDYGFSPLYMKATIYIATDVNCLLSGKDGARMFDAQKGATEEEQDALERKTRRWIDKYHYDEKAGDGAAGGFSAGLRCFLKHYNGEDAVHIISGVELIGRISMLKEKIDNLTWVITGEGRYDSQTSRGKVVSYIQELSKHIVIICGESEHNGNNIFSLTNTYPKDYSMSHPYECISHISKDVANYILSCMKTVSWDI